MVTSSAWRQPNPLPSDRSLFFCLLLRGAALAVSDEEYGFGNASDYGHAGIFCGGIEQDMELAVPALHKYIDKSPRNQCSVRDKLLHNFYPAQA